MPRILFVLLVLASSLLAQTDRISNAHELIISGKIDDAIALLKAADQNDPRVERELGIAYYRKNNFPQAITTLKSVLSRDPNDKEATQLLGLSLYFSGARADSIPYLQKSPDWFASSTVDARYVLGLACLEAKRFDEARAAFAQMYGVSPDSASGYFLFARMLLTQNDEPRAEENARKAIELDPKLPLVHYLLGEFLVARNDVEGGIREFESELKLNPAHAPSYYRIADSYARMEKWDDAQRYVQRSIWLDSTWSGPYILMGRVLLKRNENEQAARSLRRAISMDPKNDMSHFLMGQALRALGDEQNAQREFQVAKDLKAASNREEQMRTPK
jgi:tetratricopeptide (TPR) repeat protein